MHHRGGGGGVVRHVEHGEDVVLGGAGPNLPGPQVHHAVANADEVGCAVEELLKLLVVEQGRRKVHDARHTRRLLNAGYRARDL